jgi:ABC-type ATPase involved in cell division
VSAGEWLAIAPEPDAETAEPSPPLARLLATLGSPLSGSVELFHQALGSLSYVELQRVRTRIGFVVSHGGLLSNRTLAENIGLPISVHSRLEPDEERERVSALMTELHLSAVADKRPDDVDGATRFRVCVARAMALSAPWIVVEGTGDFSQPRSPTWERIEAYRSRVPAAIVVCLRAADPKFEEWLAARGGRVLRYRLLPEAT